MKSPYDELDELILNEARYFNPHGNREELREEDLYKHLMTLLHDSMKRAFILGHSQGCISSIDSLPEDIRGKYEFDAELDKFHASSLWDKVKDKLEE